MRWHFLALVIAALAAPQSALAQGQVCDIVRTPGSRGTTYREQQMTFMGGGVRFLCPGGLAIRSDSLAHIEAAGLVEFIGNVSYADSVKTLTSAYAQYIGRDKQVIARDNVVLTDKKNGSQIHAPYLQYYQESETRPEPLVMIYSGRPRAILIRAPETAPPDTTTVDADAMEIHGERLFIGRGNVVITRGAMQAFGMEANLDQEGDSMRLSGRARIVSENYRLNGDTINALMTAENTLREVIARRQATVESADMEAEAPWIRILFEEGEVNRLVAVGGRLREAAAAPAESAPREARAFDAPARGGATDPALEQAKAVSADFRLIGDSIDAIAPRQQLESVLAVGTAFGERLNVDTLSGPRPEVAARDWMRGDTILATFVAKPKPVVADIPASTAADTAKAERMLEAIIAAGGTGPAQSLYAMPDERDASAQPSFSYILAQRIAVALKDGEVASVQAIGKEGQPVHGIYLQPTDSARASTPGTARAGRTGNQ
jgi:hypothetical protein